MRIFHEHYETGICNLRAKRPLEAEKMLWKPKNRRKDFHNRWPSRWFNFDRAFFRQRRWWSRFWVIIVFDTLYRNKKHHKNLVLFRFRPVKLDIFKDIAYIFQTSGTTGLNKGIADHEKVSICLARATERTFFKWSRHLVHDWQEFWSSLWDNLAHVNVEWLSCSIVIIAMSNWQPANFFWFVVTNP